LNNSKAKKKNKMKQVFYNRRKITDKK